MNEKNCVFCKIVAGEIPAIKVYEDGEILAFLDIAPVNIGHSLVIPKKHFPNVYETPEEILGDMMKVAKSIAHSIKLNLKADGVNITMNNDSAAGQIIFHSHIHIIPRTKEDGFGMWKGRRGYNEGEKEEVAKKIASATPLKL